MSLILPRNEWSLAELAAEEEDWDEYLWSLTDEQRQALLYDWQFWARPKQLMPEDEAWKIVFLRTGRGFGKTLTGAQYVRGRCEDDTKARIMLVGPTRLDVRETMIEGETGILSVCPPWYEPEYRPSRLRLRWIKDGKLYGIAQGYSADKPDRLRGGNWTDVWGDEFAAWDKPEAWKNIKMALRKGRCRCVLTSTPKVTEQVQQLSERAEKEPEKVRLVRGSSYENASNLGEDFWDEIKELEGTTYGRQEIGGELVEDLEGALYKSAWIKRWPKERPLPAFVRAAVALDPADSLKSTADEFGIVAGGLARDGTCYVTADKSGVYAPPVWARIVLDLVADGGVIVMEAQWVNNLTHTIRTALKPRERMPQIVTVQARANKVMRAAPGQVVYGGRVGDDGKVIPGKAYHVGYHTLLETEMTSWIPGVSKKSPNRMDAHSWLIQYLYPNVIPNKVTTSKSSDDFWSS